MTFANFPLHPLTLGVEATGKQRKCKVTWSKIMYFSGFEHYSYIKSLVLLRHFRAEMLHITALRDLLEVKWSGREAQLCGTTLTTLPAQVLRGVNLTSNKCMCLLKELWQAAQTILLAPPPSTPPSPLTHTSTHSITLPATGMKRSKSWKEAYCES